SGPSGPIERLVRAVAIAAPTVKVVVAVALAPLAVPARRREVIESPNGCFTTRAPAGRRRISLPPMAAQAPKGRPPCPGDWRGGPQGAGSERVGLAVRLPEAPPLERPRHS